MENTKALEAARKWAADTITLKDDGLSVSIAITSVGNVIQTAIDEATADLRAQLAEANQKIHASNVFVAAAYEDEIEQLKAQLADAQKQLERYHGAVSRHLPPKYEIAQNLLWVPNGNGGWTTGDEITPKYRRIALEAIEAYEATRQPTQNKGDE